jgi:predicted cation transporter
VGSSNTITANISTNIPLKRPHKVPTVVLACFAFWYRCCPS